MFMDDDTRQCFSGSTIFQVSTLQGIHNVHGVHCVHGVHGVYGAGGVHGAVDGGDRQQAEAISCSTVLMPGSTFYLHTTPLPFNFKMLMVSSK